MIHKIRDKYCKENNLDSFLDEWNTAEYADWLEKELAKQLKSPAEKYKRIGEFSTVGELKKLLETFGDNYPIGFINQPQQDLYYRVGGGLGFQ